MALRSRSVARLPVGHRQGRCFASLVGTLELIAPRAGVSGFVIKQFRGDPTLHPPFSITARRAFRVSPLSRLLPAEEDGLHRNAAAERGGRSGESRGRRSRADLQLHDFDPSSGTRVCLSSYGGGAPRRADVVICRLEEHAGHLEGLCARPRGRESWRTTGEVHGGGICGATRCWALGPRSHGVESLRARPGPGLLDAETTMRRRR